MNTLASYASLEFSIYSNSDLLEKFKKVKRTKGL